MEKGKSLAVKQEVSATDLIQQAIDKNVSVETMEKLMDLQDRWDKKKAKMAFDEAMANFQASCPIIKKTKAVKTNSGSLAYKYAPIEDVVLQTKNLIKENGFSYYIKTETLEKNVKAICIVKHTMGHSEESTMEVPLGTKTNIMSDSQVVAAALTFAKRYAFLNAFGIMTGDEDNDAQTKQKPLRKLTVEDAISKANELIDGANDMDMLANIAKRIEASKSFSSEEKEKLLSKVNLKIDKLANANS